MAKSTTGKWVSRVGAGGGGKAYRKTRPMNYYGAMALIVVLGLLTVVYSRYEYQNPSKPTVGTTWFASFAAQACGTDLPVLTPDTATFTAGFSVTNNNVLVISPKTADEAGGHATVAKFLEEHPGLTFTGNSFSLPNAQGAADSKYTFKNGDKCPAGSPDAGKVGKVSIAYWSTLTQKDPTITTDPGSIKFHDLMRLTFFFGPEGATPKQPSDSTQAYMVQLQQSTNGTGTTTSTIATTPSVPVTSTTVITPTSSTTVPHTTTSTATHPTTTVAPTTTTTVS